MRLDAHSLGSLECSLTTPRLSDTDMPGCKKLTNDIFLLLGLACTAMFVCACDVKPDSSMRLGPAVIPLSQEIALDIDPARDDYTGRTATQLDIRKYTDTISFHALDMDLESVVLEGDDDPIALDWSVGALGRVSARAPEFLKPGRYTLKIEFSNDFNRKGVAIYKTKHAGAEYVFTQFEPEFARQAFPCWDDPSVKIRWRIILTTPKGNMAISNTQIQKVTPDGKKRITRFDRTRPMPSYLLAIVVGPMEAVDVRGMSVPGRIITPQGQKHLADTARKISPKLLKTLEEYFQCPYPYNKLDQIAVPEFNFGAMENAGAIIYRDTILLLDPKIASVEQRSRQARIIAHEMAHMWFGNLVTPKWWDDLWLNESFATWMALKTVRKVHPEFELATSDINSRERAMSSDAVASTRPIRRAVSVDANKTRLFNSLAYSKGMSVLTMVEDWVGPENFRKGIIQYTDQHRWGNADAFDLAEALSKVDDSDINAIMKDFVTLSGAPLVKVEFTGVDSVRLTQSRYRLYGQSVDTHRSWTLPVMLRYSDGHKEYNQRVLMTDTTVDVKLQTAILRKVDGWLYPNADEKGYYRWAVEKGELRRLARIVRTKFDTRRKLGFLGNVSSLFYAGEIDVDELLRIAGSFNLDPSPEVIAKVAELLDDIHTNFVTKDIADDYADYLRGVLGKSLQKIGLNANTYESPHTASLRARLIGLLVEKGGDAVILERARRHAAEYVRNAAAVDPNLAGVFLRLSAITGDAKLFDKYAFKYETAIDPARRANFLDALSNFRDPDLMGKSLKYAMSGSVKPGRVYKIIFGQARDEETRRRLFDWITENYEAIRNLVPAQAMPYYPRIADGRSLELLKDARSFFLDKKNLTSGMEDEMRKVTDAVQLRIRLGEKNRDKLVKFLSKSLD